ncbi:MAG: UDP-N-acetylglucosamine 2-epimerase [Acidimicrobiales bacterium]
MKVEPVVDALEGRGVEVNLVHTGQHYDAQMSEVFFGDIGLRTPDHHLGVAARARSGRGCPFRARARVLALEKAA